MIGQDEILVEKGKNIDCKDNKDIVQTMKGLGKGFLLRK